MTDQKHPDTHIPNKPGNEGASDNPNTEDNPINKTVPDRRDIQSREHYRREGYRRQSISPDAGQRESGDISPRSVRRVQDQERGTGLDGEIVETSSEENISKESINKENGSQEKTSQENISQRDDEAVSEYVHEEQRQRDA